MPDKTFLLPGLYATSTGMSLSVPMNDVVGRTVDVYLNLNDIGSIAGQTGADVKITPDGFKARNSAGGSFADYTEREG